MIKIQLFAILKEYFSEEINIEVTEIKNTSELIHKLTLLNPSAAQLLKRCRIAVDMEFVSIDYKLKENDTICIIPPSSGG